MIEAPPACAILSQQPQMTYTTALGLKCSEGVQLSEAWTFHLLCIFGGTPPFNTYFIPERFLGAPPVLGAGDVENKHSPSLPGSYRPAGATAMERSH